MSASDIAVTIAFGVLVAALMYEPVKQIGKREALEESRRTHERAMRHGKTGGDAVPWWNDLPIDGFTCEACGERVDGAPYNVRVDVSVEQNPRAWFEHRSHLWSVNWTYPAYCQRCANRIALCVTRMTKLDKLNKGSLTNVRGKLDAERRMAEIGGKIWDDEFGDQP